jgi:hypothetical protein
MNLKKLMMWTTCHSSKAQQWEKGEAFRLQISDFRLRK